MAKNDNVTRAVCFQKHVGDHFSELLSITIKDSSGDALLSISWLRHLLDELLYCEAELKVVVLVGCDPSQIVKPPLDKLLSKLLYCVVKSLDVCNVVALGLDAQEPPAPRRDRRCCARRDDTPRTTPRGSKAKLSGITPRQSEQPSTFFEYGSYITPDR